MKSLNCFILLLTSFLFACAQEEKRPSIPELDLSVVQPVEYFQENLIGADKLIKWCKENINPKSTSTSETHLTNINNCKNAQFALLMPHKKGEYKKGKTYSPE